MSWSYRADRSDETYASTPGPALVQGDRLTDAQAAPAGDNKVKLYTADGAIDVRTHTAVAKKGSAAAMTLAAPTADGIVIKFITGDAFASTLTSTGRINDGVTGGAKNTYTAAAFVGSSITLESYGGQWMVVSQNKGAVA